MTTLSNRILNAARTDGAVTFVGSGEPVRVTWSQLHDEARAYAAVLQDRGIVPGAHVALLGPTSRELVTAVQATWLAGATVVVLPIPMRMGSIDEFVAQTRARVLAADVEVLVADPQLAAFLAPEPGDPPVLFYPELIEAAVAASPFTSPKEDRSQLAILQFTSGSTSDPKGVMLPQEAVCNNLDAIAQGAQVDPVRDVVVSWLPLYHDMGLIGLLGTCMTTGMDLVLAAPQDFLAQPVRWMQWMSDYRGTITAGPNFSYALAARALRRAEGLDLSSWRIAANGAEHVDPATVDDLVEAGARHGLRPEAVFPVFGMAEATLAVAFPVPGVGMERETLLRGALETERRAVAAPEGTDPAEVVSFARLGKAVLGIEMRIVDTETGAEAPERVVGELEIRGNSVTPGYYRRPDATEAAFHDDWFRTGDLAYLVDEQLVVCGRLKDVIIVGGRNVYPQDIEKAAACVEGVRPGNVIAFGTPGRRGKEAFVVVAESKSDAYDVVRDAVKARVYDAIGLPPDEIVLIKAGTLPKTSSGKLQRQLCRQQYEGKALVSLS